MSIRTHIFSNKARGWPHLRASAQRRSGRITSVRFTLCSALLLALLVGCSDDDGGQPDAATTTDASPLSDDATDPDATQDAQTPGCTEGETRQLPCPVANGVGHVTDTCQQNAWLRTEDCTADECDPGYYPEEDQCQHYAPNGTIYYVSATGLDTNDGLSPSTPWQSISKVNDEFAGLLPGDAVLLQAGDTFSGTLVITQSGTDADPIRVGSYGSGPKPILSGFETLTGWTDLGGGVYGAASASAADLNLVILDGAVQAVGRWPNSGYRTYESHTGQTSITDNELTDSVSWTGAQVVIRPNRWTLQRNPITSHVGGTLHYTASSNYTPNDGYGYFIQRDSRTLDQLGEWFLDTGAGQLQMYFGTEDPTTHIVRVSVVDTLVSIGDYQHVTLRDLTLEGANRHSIQVIRGDHIRIRRCNLRLSGMDGINFHETESSTDCLVEGSRFDWNLNNAIRAGYGNTRLVVRDNEFTNTGMLAGMGEDRGGYMYTCLMSNGNETTIERNVIDTTGYNGVYIRGTDTVVRHNLIQNFCLVKDDGGGIYTGGNTYTGRRMEGNIILHGVGAGPGTSKPEQANVNGLYLDERSRDVTVVDNTVAWVVGNGLFFHNADTDTATGNTFFENGKAIGAANDAGSAETLQDLSVSGNVLVSTTPHQPLMRFTSIANDLDQLGTFQGNAFVRPFNPDGIIETTQLDGAGRWHRTAFDLAGWQAVFGQDTGSSVSPVAVPYYTLTGLVGSNLVTNGTFDSDLSGWRSGSYYPSDDTVVLTWESTGALDNGTLSIGFSGMSDNDWGHAYPTVTAVDSTKTYVLRFSAVGTEDHHALRIYLRRHHGDYGPVSETQYAMVGTTRREYELLIAYPDTETNVDVMFGLSDKHGTVLLDNVVFQEANVTVTDPADRFLFEYNASSAPRTFTLDVPMVDAWGNSHSGTVTLQPYSSIVLLRP